MLKKLNKNIRFNLLIILTLGIIFLLPDLLFAQKNDAVKLKKEVGEKLKNWKSPLTQWNYLIKLRIDSNVVVPKKKLLKIYFPKYLSYILLREDDCKTFYQSLRDSLGTDFKDYTLEVYSFGYKLNELIPNIFRKETAVDQTRIKTNAANKLQVVKKNDAIEYKSGLYGNNIALWASHGFYYESKQDRWKLQRARLFGTDEDISTSTYVLTYLIPMLENAGAYIFTPRERDYQLNEVVVDNDKSTGKSDLILPRNLQKKKREEGFLLKDTLFANENPFKLGTSIKFFAQKNSDAKIQYVPEFMEKGTYAVYVSYKQDKTNCTDVNYTVKHLGGETSFVVNQQIGGGTWIYLGTFDFVAGKNAETGSVVLTSNSEGYISVDALRFGGGMGNVARRPADEIMPNVKSVNAQGQKVETKKVNPADYTWKTSGRPRFLEAARYYLQYAGIPDSIVYNLSSGANDYNDDYQCRGEWVNYLIGNMNLPKLKDVEGLHIPIDMSFAFHTDAGIFQNDSIVGTLGIYSTNPDGGFFPNKQSRLASRDFTDLIMSQIVDDIHKQYNPRWTYRGMWDSRYYEARKPIVPTMLLELFSHQNQADVQYSLDPRFRFSVCRSIYKGMLKFQAYQEGRSYVVQPLPVERFEIKHLRDKTISLHWKPVYDSIEITSKPIRYKVYTRIGNSGFDNGKIVNDTTLIINLSQYDKIFSFKVTALNDGGESFPSEILSVGFKNENADKVLVVNGFDRICGPEFFDTGKMAGLAQWDDKGVPDRVEIGYCGEQYNFNRKSEWLDDDSQGWGASYGDMEGKVIQGNTFDFPYIHGEAILNAGFSFVSVSKAAFCEKQFIHNQYKTVDIILGEEKSTPQYLNKKKYDFKIYTPEFQNKLNEIIERGGNLFISGAYVGTDLLKGNDSTAIKYAKNTLHFSWRTSHAVKLGNVSSSDYVSKWFRNSFTFNTTYNPTIYTVEAPDAIEAEGDGALTAFRYGENNSSAGVLYQGKHKSVILGFPFETIVEKDKRELLMKQILNFLK